MNEVGRVRVVCVVVNWQRAALTLECLAALERQSFRDFAVIVVDNGSADDSVARIRGWMEARAGADSVPMRCVEVADNKGFSAGNNVGIRLAMGWGADFVWLLNNDTVAPSETLALLVAEADGAGEVGMVGSVLRYPTGVVQAWGGGRISAFSAYSRHYLEPHVFGRGDYLTFASVLLRCRMLERVGLLDEGFFMYYEDAEFCLRAQRAGWSMRVAAGTDVVHREGGSGGKSLKMEGLVTDSGLRLIRLHGRWKTVGSTVFVVRRTVKRTVTGRWRAAWAVVCAAVRGTGAGNV